MKPLVAYIASDVRSGSTLLDMLLGAHPQIVALGELRFLSDHVRRTGVGHSWDWRCTCGEAFANCRFWCAIDRRLRAQEGVALESLDLRTATQGVTFPLLRLSDRRLQQLGRIMRTVRRNLSCADDYWKVVDAVTAENPKRVVVDSSKTAEHFRYVHAVRPGDVRLIHLVRDGRGVATSRMHRNGITLLHGTAGWVRNNLKILIIRATVPETHRLLVTYEALCADPEREIHRVWDFLGLEPASVELSKADLHNVAGSPHRFETGETKVVADERWRRHLSKRQLLEFSLVGGWLNRWLGYR